MADLERIVVVGVDECRVDAVLRQGMLQQVVSTTVDGVCCYHMITSISEVCDSVGHCCCTGSNGEATYSTLEGCDTILEDTLCGVGQTTVDVSGILKVETVGGMLCVMEDVGCRLVDRHRT